MENKKPNFPVLFSKEGTTVIVAKIIGDKKIVQHFADLGILPGTELMIMSKNKNDLIIKVKNSKLAINENTAAQIYVSEINQKTENDKSFES